MQLEKKWYGFVEPLKRLVFVPILLIVLCVASCKAPKPISPGLLPKPIEIPKLIPVQIPPDSAWLRAYLACDSNNHVIMQAYEEQKGKGISSSLKLDNGKLDFHVVFLHDTLYIPGKDSLIYVPVEVPGPETNVLSWWQQLWIKLGKSLSSGIALYLLVRLLIKRFK